MPGVSAARKTAFKILLEMERGQAHSDDLLRDEKAMASMAAADRHLTTALVLGVLRWQIQLDQVVRRFLAKPDARLDAAVLIALRLGAFQLLHLDRVPVHAAVDESVELIKRSRIRSAAGLVNAVLRKLADATSRNEPALALKGHDFSGVSDEVLKGHDFGGVSDKVLKGHDFSRADNAAESTRALAPEGSSLAAIAAHPSWMVERWPKFFGEHRAFAICAYDQSPPAPAIRLSAPEVEQELAGEGVRLEAGHLLTAARIVQSGDIRGTAAFREGRARMQDEGSQLVAEIAAAELGPGPGKILDCCAAPGGKTLILAERNPQARIIACDASPPRLALLRQRLAQFGARVECRPADAADLTAFSNFDLVLADVPCSGTGTLSRNPEIRHRLHPQDLPRQADRQRAILAGALGAVRPGGRVVYSTCSLEPEEDEEVIAAVLDQNPAARLIPLGRSLDTLRDRGILLHGCDEKLRTGIAPQGFQRLLPGEFGTDGFFIALIEKREGL